MINSSDAFVQEGSIFEGRSPLRSPVGLFLIQTSLIVCLVQLVSKPLLKVRQPRVIAEVLVGIALGPSVLGYVPHFSEVIFPQESIHILKFVANFGLILYLFLIGMEMDLPTMIRNIRQSLLISFGGILLPFGLGAAISVLIFKVEINERDHVSFTTFLLFMGISTSITAFPVLCRILTEKKMLLSPVGITCISAAAIDDLTAWCLLVIVISVINSTAGHMINSLYTCLVILLYATVVLSVGRLSLHWLAVRNVFNNKNDQQSTGSLNQATMAGIFVLVFLSAWFTEMVGVHAIFGAFLVGMIVPREFVYHFSEKIEDLVQIVLLPLYFASSGLNTHINELTRATTWGILVLVFVMACVGKIGGCASMAKCCGMTWRESACIGVLMNTKGLVDLIVLNIGHDAGVINSRIFSLLVVVDILTTIITSPLVSLIYPPELYQQSSFDFEVSMSTKRIKKLLSFKQDRILIALQNTDAAVSAASIIRLMKPTSATANHSTAAHPYRQLLFDDVGSDSKVITIHAYRLVELSDASSSYLSALKPDEAKRSDSALNIMRVCARLIDISYSQSITTANLKDFPSEIGREMQESASDFLLVPWNYYHANNYLTISTLQKIVRECFQQAPFAIYIDRPKPKYYSDNVIGDMVPFPTKVLVVYHKGINDRKALQMAMIMFRNRQVDFELNILILNSTKHSQATSDKEEDRTVDKETAPSTFSSALLEEIDDNDLLEALTEDQMIELIEKFVNKFSSTTTSNHLINTIIIECEVPNSLIILSELEKNDYDLAILGYGLGIGWEPISVNGEKPSPEKRKQSFARRLSRAFIESATTTSSSTSISAKDDSTAAVLGNVCASLMTSYENWVSILVVGQQI